MFRGQEGHERHEGQEGQDGQEGQEGPSDVKDYLLSLPERIVRSVLGLGAGVAREVGEVALPASVRHTRLYHNLVDVTLRFLIEQVGGAEGVYLDEGKLPDDFLGRRTAGNVIEALGIVAFHASPVWVLAALADVCGMGRQLIPDIADSLKAQGLLDQDAHFSTVDQMLDGLERTSARIATAINTPPLDVAGLRDEWRAIREEARRLPPASLPTRESIGKVWDGLKTESARQGRSVFEASSVLAVSAVRAGVVRSGQIVTQTLLDHYRETLAEIRETGYLTFAGRQLRPYVHAAAGQFSPGRRTLTERVIERFRRGRGPSAP